MKKLIGFVIWLLSSNALATNFENGWYLLDTDKVQMEGYRLLNYNDPYYSSFRDPQGAPASSEKWDKGAAILWNLDLLRYKGSDFDLGIYWENKVHGEATDKQFRSVGWEYELGIRWLNHVDLYWFHHSQHLLDDSAPQYVRSDGAVVNEHYPLINEIGIRFVLYTRDGK